MKRGFLLVGDENPLAGPLVEPLIEPIVSEPIGLGVPPETDEEVECPVCLEDDVDLVMLPCRHCVCKNCTLQVWEVEQTANGSGTLVCPMCRAVHQAPQGVDVFLQEGEARGGRLKRPPSARAGGSTPRALSTLGELSTPELKGVAESLGLQHGQMLERREMLHEILESLSLDPSEVVPVRRLPPKCLTAVMRSRKIPYVDCVEKDELVRRVEQTTRGRRATPRQHACLY